MIFYYNIVANITISLDVYIERCVYRICTLLKQKTNRIYGCNNNKNQNFQNEKHKYILFVIR